MLGLPKWTELTTLQVCEISAVILAFFLVGTIFFALSAAIAATRLQRLRRQCPQCQKMRSEATGDSEYAWVRAWAPQIGFSCHQLEDEVCCAQ